MTTLLSILPAPIWSILFPVPPSSNKMFFPVATRGRSRMVISPEYKKWRECLAFLDWDPCDPFRHKVFLVLEIQSGQSLIKADCDNLIKAPIDALVRHGILIDDDRDIVRGAMSYFGAASDTPGDGFIRVSIYHESILNGLTSPPELFDS